MTEIEIKKLIKGILSSEIDKMDEKLQSIKDEISTIKKKYVDEDEVRKIVRKMIVNQHKWMWEKSSTYINKL